MSMRVEKRAWWMVAWLSVAGMVSVNSLVLTPFSVLLKPIGAEFGWSRTQTSSLVSIMALLSALILPGVGKLLDVYGTRRIVVPAAALVSGILVVMAFLPNIYVLWLAVLAVMGLAVASLSGMPVGRLGARWVDAKRGLATGIIGTGGAIGIAISPLLVGAITASAGWRTAFIALAIATLVIHLLPMAFIVRDPTPAEDRALGHHAHGQTNELPGLSIKECLRTRHLWVMLVSTAIIGCAVPGALIHLVAMLTDKGIEPAKAIAAVSFMAIATVAGRLVGGYLLDRVYAPLVAFVTFLLPVVGFVMLAVGPGAFPLVGAMFLGFAMGCESDILGYLSSRYLGMKSFGTVYGALIGMLAIGYSVGPMVYGAIFDTTGNYNLAFLIFGGALVIVSLSMITLGKYRYVPSIAVPGASEPAPEDEPKTQALLP